MSIGRGEKPQIHSQQPAPAGAGPWARGGLCAAEFEQLRSGSQRQVEEEINKYLCAPGLLAGRGGGGEHSLLQTIKPNKPPFQGPGAPQGLV